MILPVKCKFHLGFVILLCLLQYSASHAQKNRKANYTRVDSLRGHLNAFRSCFDVKYYDLTVHVDPDHRSIAGCNHILMESIRDFNRIQLDLFSNMEIDSVIHAGQLLPFTREGNAFHVHFPLTIRAGDMQSVSVYYHGKPVVAKHPPWDGGFVWAIDSLHRHWIGVSCEGIGASLWWPNKDHLSDRPDSMRVSMIIPDYLTGVSNGRLVDTASMANGNKRWTWKVSYPINNYNISLNIAYYSHFQETFLGLEGSLDLNFYVLDYNLYRAKEQFQQVQPMLMCYEHYFGPYPFIRDSYKLVETSYWGMEHQSGIAYGNNFRNNEFGFDYIIIHESGHEYWGNSVSIKDLGELWVHESFATYMESLFMEYFHGKELAAEYLELQKENIENRQPILGPLEVNYDNWMDADMYYKGAWMLHSLRNTINNDSAWFTLLRNTYEEFKYKTVTSQDIIEYMNAHTEYDLMPIFNHFLTKEKVPLLKVKEKRKTAGLELTYKWKEVEDNFNMPVEIKYRENDIRLYPTVKKQKRVLSTNPISNIHYVTDRFYYILKRE